MTDLITDHMDIWTGAQIQKANGGRGRGKNGNGQPIYGIKKLRELILELAVRGKLVPQDPDDEPASVLLDRIAEEKKRLIQEGKIKKQTKLPEIGEDEKRFQLPAGWEWTRLALISQINPRNTTEDGTNASFIPMPLISTSHKGEHGQEIRTWGKIKKGYTHFADGDIGIAKITPCFENSKAVVFSGLENGIGAGTTELHVARPFGETLSARYILLFFKSPVFLLVGETTMTGTAGQKRLPKAFFSEFPLPFPPLPEQHRIVAKVDELMALCDQLEQQQTDNNATHQILVETLLTTLTTASDPKDFDESWQRIANHFDTLFTTEQSIDHLKQTILQLAVMGRLVPQNPDDEPASVLLEKIAKEKGRLVKEGKIKKQKKLAEIGEDEKPFEVPLGWEWVRFNQLVDPEYLISYGVLVPGLNVENGVPFIRIADLDLTNPPQRPEKSIDEKIDEKYERTRIIGGEILMGVVGSIGKLGIAPDSWRGANIARAICRIVPSKFVHKPFIIWLLQSDLMQNGFKGNTRTLAQPTLNIGLIRDACTPLPPLGEQQRIVTKTNELMAICDTLKARLNDAQTTQVELADAIVEQAVG